MKTTRPLSAKGLLARSMDELRRRSAIGTDEHLSLYFALAQKSPLICTVNGQGTAWNLEAIKGPAGPRPLYDFCDEESVQDCIVMSDNRIGGSSQSNLDFISPSSTSPSFSVADHAKGCPAGWTPENKVYPFPMDGLPPQSAFARFHGRISTSLPADRPNVHRSGFAAFRTPDQHASLFGNSVWDIDPYTYLALRVKSDGRAYFLNLQTEGIEPSDLHQHRLFARHPGQWETIMVKWNDFVRTNHGSVVEPQSEILRQKISTFGIGLTNRIEGPFELCIEKVWATNEIFDNAIVITSKESQLRNRSGKTIYWRRDQFNLHKRQPSPRAEGPFMARIAEAFDWAIEPPSRSHEEETIPSGESQPSIHESEIIRSEEPQPRNSAAVSQRGEAAIDPKEPRSGKCVAPGRKGEVHRSEESQSSWKSKANTARRETKQRQSNASQGTKERAETKSEDSGWEERGFGMGKHVRSRRRRVTTPLEEASRKQMMQSAEKRHKGSNRDELMRSMTSQIHQKRMDADLDASQPQSSMAKLIRSSETQLESSLGEGTVQEAETWRKNSIQDKMMQSGKIQNQRRRGEEMMQWAETLHLMTGSAETPLKESTMPSEMQRENSGEDEVAHSIQFKHQNLKRENTVLKAEMPCEAIQSMEMPREETMPSAETREKTTFSREIPREDAIPCAEISNEDSDQSKTYSAKVQDHSHGHEATMSTAETPQEDTAEASKTLRQGIELWTETHRENSMQSAEILFEKGEPLAGMQGDDTMQPAGTCPKTIPSIQRQGEQTVPSVGIPHEETILPVETQREQAISPPEMPRKEAAGPKETPGQGTIASAATQAPEMIRTAEMRCNEIMRLAEMQCRNIMQSLETQCKGIIRSAETRGEKTMRPIGEQCEEMQHEETAQEMRVKERQLEDMQVREMLQSSEMPREEKQGKETQSEDSRHSDETAQPGPQTQPASGCVQAAPSDEAQAGSDGGHGEADRPGQGQSQGVLRNRKGVVVRW